LLHGWQSGQGYDYDSRVRLSYVNYGNSRGASWPQYQVFVGYTDTTDTGRLTNIWVNRKAGSGWATIRYYNANYNGYGQLESVIEVGSNDNANWYARPGTSFQYGAYAPPQDETKHLKIVNNSYGGQTEFNYEILPGGYRRVNGLVQRDVNTGWASFKTYTYTGACYNTTGSQCRTGHDWNEPNGALIGHALVDEVQRAGVPYDWNAAALQTVRHAFHVDTHRLGRESATSVLDGGGNTLHLTEHTWNDVPASALAAGWPSTAWAAELSKRRTYPFGNGGAGAAFWSEVEHGYESVLASPLIRQENKTWTRTSSGTGQRTDFTRYTWNSGAGMWIIKTAWVNTYAGIVTTFNPGCASGLKSQVILYYDGNNTNTSATPTRGLVTRATTGSTCPNEKNATQYFGYDGAAVGAISATGAGNLTSAQDPNGNPATTAVYDGMGLFMTQLTNPAGHIEKYYYMGINVTSVDARGQYGQLEAVDDPNNVRTHYTYDALGRLKKVIKDGNSHMRPTVEYFYLGTNGASDLSAGFAPPLMVQTFTRKDAAAGLPKPAHPDSAWWTASGGADTTAIAVWGRALYDGLGRDIQTHQPAPSWPGVNMRVVAYTRFDVAGRAAERSVPHEVDDTAPYYTAPDLSKPKTTTTYDALGRALTVTGPDNATTTYEYGLNTVGAVTGIRDANGHLKQHIADPLGRMIRVREYAGTHPNFGGYDTTTYDYDIAGNLIDVWDAATPSNNTHITYDALNRKTSMSDPDMGTWSYDYDPNGNLIWQRDANQTVLTFDYDALNRLTYKRQSGVVLAWHVYDIWWDGTYGPNLKGRRSTAVAYVNGVWNNSKTWGYDTRGRVATETAYIDGAVSAYSTGYAYDSADRVIQMTYPNGEILTTNYDAAGNPLSMGRWDGIGSWSTVVGSATYNVLGQPRQLTFGNGSRDQYDYYGLDIGSYWLSDGRNPYGRLWRKLVWSASNYPLLDMQYGHDGAGNVTARFVSNNWGASWEGTRFSYDERDRLTSAAPWPGYAGESESYSYDAIGNITFKSGVGSYDYYTWGGCTGYRPHAVRATWNAGVQTSGFCYDANGNSYWRYEGGKLWLQTWTADNKLASVQEKSLADWATNIGPATQFFYDADGARVKKVDGGGTTIYVGNHYEVTNGAAMSYYYFGGQRVAMRDGIWTGQVFWLHDDHLGSASLITTNSGAWSGELRYTPYGETRSASGNIFTEYRFTGQRSFSGIGLYDYGARFYSPTLGRFISADTIVPGAGNPQALNRYSMVLNNPLKYTDPTGHAQQSPDGAGFHHPNQIYDYCMLKL
jgi:RHS repeat-associated protein